MGHGKSFKKIQVKIFNYLNKFNFNSDSVILEIGCHHGYDTDQILDICPDSKIYIFEPDPRNISILKDRGIDKKVKLIEACVSNNNNKQNLYLSEGLPPAYFENVDEDMKKYCQSGEWTASSSIKKPKEHLEVTPWCEFNESVEVDSITLDYFFKNEGLEKIDFVWMDVQGAEDLVFEGAQQLLTNNKINYMYTEYSDRELYENQMNLKQITEGLPNYEILDFFNESGGTDVLLKNKNL